MKEFSGEDPDAFLVDKAEEQATRQKEEREAALRVPGMVKPSDIQVDDEEL
jgi:exportin-1